MCGHRAIHSKSCCCQAGQSHQSLFMSKKRRISYLEDQLKGVTEYAADLKALIKEIKAEA